MRERKKGGDLARSLAAQCVCSQCEFRFIPSSSSQSHTAVYCEALVRYSYIVSTPACLIEFGRVGEKKREAKEASHSFGSLLATRSEAWTQDESFSIFSTFRYFSQTPPFFVVAWIRVWLDKRRCNFLWLVQTIELILSFSEWCMHGLAKSKD